MNRRFQRNVFQSLALIALASSALLASAAGTPPDTVPGKKDGAKDLFYQQLGKPQLAMNTGLQYWIELNRKGEVKKVSNKIAFYSGDQIRFHIRPNIDGYAYVLLKCGSKGNREVLYPLAKFNDDNHIASGRDIAIPAPGTPPLLFDSDPGTESVGIVLSRTPLDPNQYLNKTQPVVIASGLSGSKDLVPSRIVMQPAAVPGEDSGAQTTAVVASSTDFPPVINRNVTENPGNTSNSTNPHTRPASPVIGSAPSTTPLTNKEETGVTTVVHQDAGALGIDVVLQHL